MGCGDHIEFISTLFQPMLHYCKKLEDFKFHIFKNMTYCKADASFFRTPGMFNKLILKLLDVNSKDAWPHCEFQ